MKITSITLFLGMLSLNSFAGNIEAPIDGVSVFDTVNHSLSIQNMSSEVVGVDIFGEEFLIYPLSGVNFDCAGYKYLEVKVKNTVHDYLEVQCNSRVVFNPEFSIVEVEH